MAGIIDGDVYIAVTRTTKGYIEKLLVISLDHKDRDLLEDIKKTIGFGRINGPFYNKDGTITSKLVFTRVTRNFISTLYLPWYILFNWYKKKTI